MVVAPDWVLYVGYAGVLGLLLGWALARARTGPRAALAAEEPEEREPKEPAREERREPLTLDSAIGVDRALARKFLAELRRAVADGKVRIVLASPECPGRVVYDFMKERFLCVSDGKVWPLGEQPSDVDIVEDEV